MRKVKYNMRDISNSEFLLRTRAIQGHLSQPMFDTITPSPSEVLPLLEQLEILMQKVMNGDASYVPQRNELRTSIRKMVSRQCQGVNSLSGGEVTILEQSGFELYKEREARPVPRQVSVVEVANGNNSGEVKLEFSKPKYADSYIVQMSIAVEDDWKTVATTNQRKLVLYHVPEKEYAYFRVAAFNNRGMGEWSNTVRLVVGR